MKVENAVIPNEEQIKGFFEEDSKGPIYMINLLKFKEKAEYDDGRETSLSGKEAYGLYGAGVSKLLVKHGGGAMFSAEVARLMLGDVEDLWDSVAIAVYPSRQAMMAMMQDPGMKEIGDHRKAGLAGQLNIETVDAKGLWFGDKGI